MIEANGYGWTSPRILFAFALAVVALGAFILLERHQKVPMLDLSLFRSTTYVGANVVLLLVALAMFGVFFFISLYMQNVLGYSAVQAGAAFLPMTILIILVAPLGQACRPVGSRSLMTVGMVLIGAVASFLRARRDRHVLDLASRAPRRLWDGADDDAARRPLQ